MHRIVPAKRAMHRPGVLRWMRCISREFLLRDLRVAILGVAIASSGRCFAAPNIVVVMTDDQAISSLPYMPKLHALVAEKGIAFTNSFVNLPLCAPSRASFLTGQAAHNHAIKSNSPLDAGGWDAFKDKEADTLPVWLQAAGYKTALIGKYLNRYGQQSLWGAWLSWLGNLFGIELKGNTVGNPRDWVPQGWDLWYAFTGSRVRYYDYWINENGKILSFGDNPTDYSTDVLRDRAVRFISEQSGSEKPFFLYLAPKAAHAEGPHAVPSPKYEGIFRDVKLPIGPSFNERHVSRKAIKAPRITEDAKQELELSYQATLQALQSVDELVAAVVEALQVAGKLDDTFLIYTSDNGFLFGEHRLIGKSTAYEESVKVPLLMRGPGIPENETRPQLVDNLDVVATIADLANARPTVVVDGRSLASLFANPTDTPWREFLLLESPVNRFQDPKKRYSAVRTLTTKYVKYDGGFEELFELDADPHELNNEAENPIYASDLQSLRNVQKTLKSCKGESCWGDAPRGSE